MYYIYYFRTEVSQLIPKTLAKKRYDNLLWLRALWHYTTQEFPLILALVYYHVSFYYPLCLDP